MTARSFIAGLLVHAREYTAVTNQWVNSYKRLFPLQLPDRITESPAYCDVAIAATGRLASAPFTKAT